MVFSIPRQFSVIGFLGLAALICGLAACRSKQPDVPPVATPSVTLGRARAPLNSPLDIKYTFVVANDAHFEQDYRVMVHVVDAEEELIWTDDHNPPTPTTQWKPGQTVE